MKKAWRTLSSSVRTPYFATVRGRMDALSRRAHRTLRRIAFGSMLVTILASAAAAALMVGALAPPNDIPRQELPRQALGEGGPLAPVEIADEPGAGRLAAPLAAAAEPLVLDEVVAPSVVSATTATVLEVLQLEIAVDAAEPALEVAGAIAAETDGTIQIESSIPAGSDDGIQPTIDDVEVPGVGPAPPVVTGPPEVADPTGPTTDEEPPVISDPVEVPVVDAPDEASEDTVDEVTEGADEVGDAIDTPAPEDTVDEVTDTVDEVAETLGETADPIVPDVDADLSGLT